MKKLLISRSFLVLVLLGINWSCSKTDPAPATPTTPEYQTVIEAKFKALGWDKDGHALFNGTGPVKTVGGKGYVQYYAFGTRKTAIYYFDGKGAFSMDTAEMTKYEALGADNFAFVVSDPKSSGTGSGHNEIIKISDNSAGIIISTPNVGTFVVYGEIYKKYLAINRWSSPLGYPISDELPTPADNGRFNSFSNGVIWSFPTTGTNALWGKIIKLYLAIDYERSWLGKPTESCDPNKGDANQRVGFENGSVGVGSGGTCGNYYNKSGLSVLQTGKTSSSVIPCY